MLNEVPNNNDVKRIANIMLNEAPNCNNATCVGNNVRLTAVGANQFFMAAMYSYPAEKPTYQKPEVMT